MPGTAGCCASSSAKPWSRSAFSNRPSPARPTCSAAAPIRSAQEWARCCRRAGLNRLAAIALGSNLGDRAASLAFSVARLERLLQGLRVSSAIETEPSGVSGHQPKFLNAAAVGETDLSARALLSELLDIERQGGRERPYPGAARTLDLDLLLLGEEI